MKNELKKRGDSIIKMCKDNDIVEIIFESFKGTDLALSDYIREKGIDVKKREQNDD